MTCVPMCTSVFQPVEWTLTCQMDVANAIYMRADVTWTAATALAFVAAKLRCNVDVLKLSHEGLPVIDTDYLREFTSRTFDVSFHVQKPAYACTNVKNAPVKDTGMAPRLKDHVRFVAKRPLIKTTKTAAFPAKSTLGDVVRGMFPDIADTAPWKIVVEGADVDALNSIAQVSAFCIEWTGYRPITPTEVQVCEFQWPLDTPYSMNGQLPSPSRWVKSPFRTKAQIMHLPRDLSLTQVAASFVAHTMLNTNIMCQVGGKVIDPTLQVHQIPIHCGWCQTQARCSEATHSGGFGSTRCSERCQW